MLNDKSENCILTLINYRMHCRWYLLSISRYLIYNNTSSFPAYFVNIFSHITSNFFNSKNHMFDVIYTLTTQKSSPKGNRKKNSIFEEKLNQNVMYITCNLLRDCQDGRKSHPQTQIITYVFST